MELMNGKTAFVTGGAGGIGLGIARALARRGANIMLADVDTEAMDMARNELLRMGCDVDIVQCDVSDPAAVQMALEAVRARFGRVHIVINNAGVACGGVLGTVPLEDWRWAVDINLMGVVHVIEAFAPVMRAQNEGGYFVNTASIAGHIAAAGLGPYTATKYAVVGLSETLRQDLAGDGIGVSVLCPGWVRTGIAESAGKRPSAANMTEPRQDGRAQEIQDAVNSGLDPDVIGEWTAECIAAGRFYIFSHPSMLENVTARMSEISADYAACADDPRFQNR